MGLFTRTVERISASGRSEDADLREDAARAGCDLIARHGSRELVTVHGVLRSVTLRPRSGVCALEAELYDGSACLRVVWLGRRQIAGIATGRQLTVVGRLSVQEGERVMFNPRYELTA
ncbi:MAG: OB-fold nucleic acid binding domain-containing protein [Nocardioidaceae bacterium]|nr:OB-fold nucleic acid binding domain-containing protein [Nocardioidaceae bacterium]